MGTPKETAMAIQAVGTTPPELRIAGEIDHFDSDKLREHIRDMLGKGDRLLIDMSAVVYLDSGAVAILFWLGRELIEMGGKAAIIVTDANIWRILEIVRLTELPTLKMAGNREEALGYLEE